MRFKKPFRLIFIVVLMVLLGGALLYQLSNVFVHDRAFLTKQGAVRSERHQAQPAPRGMILDRNGYPLALSAKVVDVWVDPARIDWRAPHWSQALYLLDVPQGAWDKIKQKYHSRRFAYLKRHVSPAVVQKLKALQLKGLHFSASDMRFYPEGEAFAPLIGITHLDQRGQEGLEKHFDDWLTGASGKLHWEQDVLGRKVDYLTPMVDHTPGRPLVLSVDKRVQHIVYKALKQAVVKNKAQAGSAVVVSVKNGEVLAMASYPATNPNDRTELTMEALKNRVVLDQFEPGSVMKPFAMAAVLSSGQYSLEDTVETSPGYVRIGGHTVRDTRNHGTLKLPEVIKYSSNVGIGKLVTSVSEEQLPSTLALLGFGQPTGVEVQSETAGVLPVRQRWAPFTLATLAFGYGVAVSTLQLAQAYATLANHGEHVPLTLLKRSQVPQPERKLDAHVADAVIKMMTEVTQPGGTGYRASVPGFTVAGKTGTVRKAVAGGYADDQYVAVFVGIVPAQDPQLAMVIMVDNPRGDKYYGGSVAAPVFAQSMKAVLPVLHILPKRREHE